MKTAKIPVLAFAFTLTLGFSACKKSEAPGPGGQAIEAQVQAEKTVKEGDGKGTSKSYVKKDSYFKLPDHKGGEIDLAAYGGKPVLLMFFTEGCPFCRKAAPFIQKMHQKYAAKGLRVIGVCLETAPEAAAGFAEDFSLTFPIAYKGRDVARRYRTSGVPYIYLLTKDHVIHNVWAGYDPEFDEPIIKGIEDVLNGR